MREPIMPNQGHSRDLNKELQHVKDTIHMQPVIIINELTFILWQNVQKNTKDFLLHLICIFFFASFSLFLVLQKKK